MQAQRTESLLRSSMVFGDMLFYQMRRPSGTTFRADTFEEFHLSALSIMTYILDSLLRSSARSVSFGRNYETQNNQELRRCDLLMVTYVLRY